MTLINNYTPSTFWCHGVKPEAIQALHVIWYGITKKPLSVTWNTRGSDYSLARIGWQPIAYKKGIKKMTQRM